MLRQMKLLRWQRVCISKRFCKSKRACKSKTGICVGNDAVYGGAKASPFLFFQFVPGGQFNLFRRGQFLTKESKNGIF